MCSSQLTITKNSKFGSESKRRMNIELSVSNSFANHVSQIDKMDVLTKENAMLLQKIVEARQINVKTKSNTLADIKREE